MKNIKYRAGQGAVEFALFIPILMLVFFGALELGRAFFAYIAVANAAREGTRVFTFRPDVTTIANVNAAIRNEIGSTILVDETNIAGISIQCGNFYANVTTDAQLQSCPKEEPIRVTVTYDHELIISLVFPDSITLSQSAEMMVP